MRGKVDHSNNILLASSQRTFSFEKIEKHETECAILLLLLYYSCRPHRVLRARLKISVQ